MANDLLYGKPDVPWQSSTVHEYLHGYARFAYSFHVDSYGTMETKRGYDGHGRILKVSTYVFLRGDQRMNGGQLCHTVIAHWSIVQLKSGG